MKSYPRQSEVLCAVVDMNDLPTKVWHGVDVIAIGKWLGCAPTTVCNPLDALLESRLITDAGTARMDKRT